MKKFIVSCCLVLFYVTKLFAITEEGFQEIYSSAVRPYYEAGEFGTFQGAGDKEIAYVRFEAPDEKGAIVILHGMAESMIKYAEVVYDLKELGYSFYLMDHRGMGFSERLLEDPDKIYVKNFDDYVQDVKTFVDTVVNEKPHKRLILISHSMGGAVAARYFEQYPLDFHAAVLSAPMLMINTHEYPQIAAYMLAVINAAQGRGAEYVPGDGKYVPDTFVADTVTHSYARWSLWEEGLKNEYPEVRLGGVTYSWVKQAMEAGLLARRDAEAITIPVLLFQAEEDTYVRPEGQNNFCDSASDCRKIFFYGARHEILMEIDSVRDVAINYMREFIKINE